MRDIFDSGVCGREVLSEHRGVVGRTIVDNDQFEQPRSLEDFADYLRDRSFFIKNGHNHREDQAAIFPVYVHPS